jgi:hypothetical protein
MADARFGSARLNRTDQQISPTETQSSMATGTFAEGEGTLADRDAEDRVHHRVIMVDASQASASAMSNRCHCWSVQRQRVASSEATGQGRFATLRNPRQRD